MSELCHQLHRAVNGLQRLGFPDGFSQVPSDGIYILFEKREKGHGNDRIVRVGTHTGKHQLMSRLKQHFINENKDRSIFRKNIGRAMLKRDRDSFLADWEIDLTTKKSRSQHESRIDGNKQQLIEKNVSRYIQGNLSYVVISEADREKRLDIESKIISTVSWCDQCGPSRAWLGLHSPKEKIRRSGLWVINGLYKEPLSDTELRSLVVKVKPP